MRHLTLFIALFIAACAGGKAPIEQAASEQCASRFAPKTKTFDDCVQREKGYMLLEQQRVLEEKNKRDAEYYKARQGALPR